MKEDRLMGENKTRGFSIPVIPQTYKGLTLDPFQVDAIIRIQQQTSVIVSAPTGTGKSLIADYLVEYALNHGQKVYYTVPIKALANQKYRDYAQSISPAKTGMITGDHAINPKALVVIMTTEVFRNMILKEEIEKVKWVVFDEVHYLNDPDRGTVWEESVLLMPPSMNLLALSATVPNVSEIASWISQVRKEEVHPIIHRQRAVPLRHLYFNQLCEAVEHSEIWQKVAEVAMPAKDDLDLKGGTLPVDEVFTRIPYTQIKDPTTHMDLINYLAGHQLFPCIYFAFSRRMTEKRAKELSQRRDYLKPKQKEVVSISVKRILQKNNLSAEDIPGFDDFQSQWYRGVGIHHAELLPVIKEIVEHLLERRILKVVYATETFAVGVNMPVRCVCFEGLEKYDGKGFRLLTSQEYIQMAGRAGRRGIDREGTVISLVDFSGLNKIGLIDWGNAGLEPIKSNLNLSYTLVLNLLRRFGLEQIEQILVNSLYCYQSTTAETGWQELKAILEKRLRVLNTLGYINESLSLLPKGEFCSGIWVKDLLVTELAHNGTLTELTAIELAGWAAAVVWEPKPGDNVLPQAPLSWLLAQQLVIEKIKGVEDKALTQDWHIEARVSPLMMRWAQGDEITSILKMTPLEAGDFAALARSTVDLLRQISTVTFDSFLKEKCTQAIRLIDRGVVAATV
jgi:superfamily II RNA helicase